MAAKIRPEVVYVSYGKVRGVPDEKCIQFESWLLPAESVREAIAKGEVIKKTGWPKCRVCGALLWREKETKQVIRFQFQTTHGGTGGHRPLGKRRNAYMHVHRCVPLGQEAPQTITHRQRSILFESF
jgi:hypothetical protein